MSDTPPFSASPPTDSSDDRELIHCVELSFNTQKNADTEDQLEGYLWALELPEFERIDESTFSDARDDHLLLAPGEVRWRFSFEAASDATRLADQLKQLFAAFEVRIDLWSRDVTGYRTAWKQYFKPYRASQRLIVHPPWDVPEAPASERLVIDPGMAFGTGTHETTRLCLGFVDSLAEQVGSIFDVGTGSGILLIGAAKLGVDRLLGVDVDPVTIPEARRNAEANEVGDRVDFALGSAGYTDERFDLAIANILPHILQSLRDELRARVADGGWLLLSGIPWSRRSEIVSSYTDDDWTLEQERRDGEWAALLLRHSPN